MRLTNNLKHIYLFSIFYLLVIEVLIFPDVSQMAAEVGSAPDFSWLSASTFLW